ncbi:MAG: helix-turn-helix domain-containing protein [Clostridia bacterium]|nr:helix-turn-helix domain-containing protein [Clostridia bacterium]
MNTETVIYLQGYPISLFLEGGFFSGRMPTDAFHRHLHTEVHVVLKGSMEYEVEDASYHMTVGDMLAVPKGIFHRAKSVSEDLFHTAWQVKNIPLCRGIRRFPADYAAEFAEEVEKGEEQANYNRLYALLTLMTERLTGMTGKRFVAITDRCFLMDECFSNHYYKDYTLKDLAEELRVGEKQAARLVVKYFHRSFREEMTHRRMEAAGLLLRRGECSLTEIAEQVGYHTYNGFWKALKRTEKTEPSLVDKNHLLR